ncbi:cytochrome ubiquinol oxidase subunit I [Nonomuraea sp. PA05]|uniref:cytochrome ubiquinol oxidase subunit I n=1 Tax=Nonomuraea sp. PA05 TaxID=2604466 RepID=UPI0011D5BCEF|nr:cytochrome ubiquinol oxidase subunit I [Nonomuraea sp. PA05]TYB51800.1 cytochrome ubiquinol oxidase subunit I [Nonomuraea sp. PA05]
MDALDLARLQFGITTSLHFLFVALTLGLAPLIAFLQTLWVVRGNPLHERLTKFWGQVYVVNYGLGIVSGLLLEFQFALNWSGLTHFAGELFGAPMALETLYAFFVESTFLGLWIFGWGRLPKVAHLLTFYVVTLAALGSAYLIVVANGFLQNPVGYERAGDALRVIDAGAVFANPAALLAVGHILPAALMVAGFLMAGVSAWYFRRGTNEVAFFRLSLRLGLTVGYAATFLTIGFGEASVLWVVRNQPTKLAGGAEALRVAERMAAEHGPGDYLAPAWAPIALTVMLSVAYLYVLFALVPLVLLGGGRIERRRFLLGVGVWTIPLPFLTVILGWIVREIGRQPWVIYDVLPTSEAVSDVGATSMLASLVIFTTLYAALVVVGYLLIAGIVRKGPRSLVLGAVLGDAEPAGRR